jgi:hypothetical protein
MANHYEVHYYLVYANNSKLSQGTTLIMESDSSSEAERQIRATGNIGSNVKEIQIIRIKKK